MKAKRELDLTELEAQGRKVLHVYEVAAVLGVTRRHVQDLIEEGQIGAIDVGGSRLKFWRVPITECRKFLERRSSLHP